MLFGLSGHQIGERGKLLFFIHYPLAGILLQQQQADQFRDVWMDITYSDNYDYSDVC